MNVVSPASRAIWRVGYAPDAWTWTDWKWSQNHHFDGRWDDADGSFRTLYAGSTLESCLVELLAPMRPDSQLAKELAAIDANADDVDRYPTVRAGEVDLSWLVDRVAGIASITGNFYDMTHSSTIACLRPIFDAKSTAIGLKDFDAAALNNIAARPLTQAIATYSYCSSDVDGLLYTSRHGGDLTLWAIYERSPSPHPRCLSNLQQFELTPAHPALISVFNMLGLKWIHPHVDLPLPIVQTSAEEVWNEIFPEGDPGPIDPLSAAMLWQQALEDPVENRPALDILTLNPQVWEYREVAELMRELSVATKVIATSDPKIKHVKFFSYAGSEAGRATEAAALQDVHIVTLCWPPEALCWQVWGLSHNWIPQPADIYATDE